LSYNQADLGDCPSRPASTLGHPKMPLSPGAFRGHEEIRGAFRGHSGALDRPADWLRIRAARRPRRDQPQWRIRWIARLQAKFRRVGMALAARDGRVATTIQLVTPTTV
jgi:hypothetical protein